MAKINSCEMNREKIKVYATENYMEGQYHIWAEFKDDGVYLTVHDNLNEEFERKISWDMIIDLAQEDYDRDRWASLIEKMRGTHDNG